MPPLRGWRLSLTRAPAHRLAPLGRRSAAGGGRRVRSQPVGKGLVRPRCGAVSPPPPRPASAGRLLSAAPLPPPPPPLGAPPPPPRVSGHPTHLGLARCWRPRRPHTVHSRTCPSPPVPYGSTYVLYIRLGRGSLTPGGHPSQPRQASRGGWHDQLIRTVGCCVCVCVRVPARACVWPSTTACVCSLQGPAWPPRGLSVARPDLLLGARMICAGRGWGGEGRVSFLG